MSAQGELLCVVVVDDEEDLLGLLTDNLRRLGHEVNPFQDPKLALKFCRSQGGRQIDIVITDRIMPEMNGSELAKDIRGLGLRIPIGMACCGVGDLSPDEKAVIFPHVDLLREKTDVLMDVGRFVGELYQLGGQAR